MMEKMTEKEIKKKVGSENTDRERERESGREPCLTEGIHHAQYILYMW